MNILYIHQYFATPKGKTGTRSYEFARRWVAAGHKVTMLTSITQLTPDDLKNAQGRFVKRFTIEGIDVRAIVIGYSQQMGFTKRVLAFLGFMIVAVFYVVCKKGYDIVYATSTPLTIGVPALCAKWLRRKKFVFEVRDQWPQVPIEMGIIKNKLLIRLLLWLEKTLYKNAAAIGALSPGMATGIKNVLGNIKKSIAVIPNSCDVDTFSPDIDGSIVRKERGWGNKFVLLHTGAMGKANGLDFLIEAAQKLKDDKDIHFVIIGDGSEKQRLVETVEKLKLGNIEFLGAISKKDLPEYIAAADVSLVIFANYPILEHNSANKFFDSLAAGRPVLLNYSGWQRDILLKNEAGYGCKLCDLDEFVKNILYLDDNRDLLPGLGNNARKLALEQFDRDKLANEVLEVIIASINKKVQMACKGYTVPP